MYNQIRGRLRTANRAAQDRQLAKLIGVLARDAVPCGWDQPERALQALRDFDLPFLVLAAVRARSVDRAGSVGSATGSVSSADVRRVFTEERIEELEPSERLEVLAELIADAHREPTNWPVADEWWERLAQHDSHPLLPRIKSTVQDLVLASAPMVTIMEYTTRADRHRMIDPLLAGLIAGPAADVGHMASAQAVAERVADSVSREAGLDALPQTQQALAGNLFLAGLLLVHLANTKQDLGPVRTWLEPALGATLTPFFTVLGRTPGLVSEQDIEILARSEVRCVAVLLTAAHGQERLDLVPAGIHKLARPCPAPARHR